MINMFDIEIQIDLNEELNNLMEHLNEEKYWVTGNHSYYSLWRIIDDNFHLWDNRASSLNTYQYLKRFNINLYRESGNSNETIAYGFPSYNDRLARLKQLP